MNGQMDNFFRVLLAIVIVFILGAAISSYLETNYSSFTNEEMGYEEGTTAAEE